MNQVLRRTMVAGATIFLAFVGSVLLRATAPTDSGQQGAGEGAVSASAVLEVVWTTLALVIAIPRWRDTTSAFRFLLGLNLLIVVLVALYFF
jgi:hypothetical protein